MWPFGRNPTKAELQAHRVVKVGGYTFTIRRVSPLLDFEPDRMPQIFSATVSRRKVREDKTPDISETRRIIEDMVAVIEAGVVKPALVRSGKGAARGAEDGITAEDIIRWEDIGVQLYQEIIAHSLSKYRGWRGMVEVSRNKAVLIDAVAKRYGQRPSDVVLPDGSEAEREMFDAFAAGEGFRAEAEASKKQVEKLKR
jgi:hypothetical protein